MHRIQKFILIFIGACIMIDAIGSICVYSTQPTWPDHSVRVLRGIFGVAIVYIGWRY